jgi:hypothetical protein
VNIFTSAINIPPMIQVSNVAGMMADRLLAIYNCDRSWFIATKISYY